MCHASDKLTQSTHVCNHGFAANAQPLLGLSPGALFKTILCFILCLKVKFPTIACVLLSLCRCQVLHCTCLWLCEHAWKRNSGQHSLLYLNSYVSKTPVEASVSCCAAVTRMFLSLLAHFSLHNMVGSGCLQSKKTPGCNTRQASKALTVLQSTS